VNEPKPNLVFKNGLVYAVDKNKSRSEAIAIAGDKILFVGDDADIEARIGVDTKVIDLNGKMVLPGFVDAHAHPSHAMDFFGNISLYLLDSPEEYIQQIESYIEKHPDSGYFRGSGWSDGIYPGLGPRKEVLDKLVLNRPIALVSYDGHSIWVNSVTLERAGISRDTPNPEGGVIERDPISNEPSGTLRETAAKLVEKVIPDYSLEERKKALLAYQDMALQAGITRSYDAMLEDHSISAFRELAREGSLKVRFNGAVLVKPDQRVEKQVTGVMRERSRNQHPYFKTKSAKIFVDGVIEGGTGFLLEPYEHRPDSYGELLWPPKKLNEMVVALDAAELQIHFHVIGDGAARLALDALEAAQVKNGERDSRHLVTHLQLVAPEDIPRFKKLGVVGVPQPFWFTVGDYYWKLALPYLGKQRADSQYPMKSFVEAGVIMASASDFPVTIPFNPVIGIQTGITRSEKGDVPEEVLWPEEKVSLEQMIESFTFNGAYANFEDKTTGSLEAGKHADLVILDRNLFEVPINEVDEVKVLATLIDGEFVYRDNGFDS
jgi:hypothetical protein